MNTKVSVCLIGTKEKLEEIVKRVCQALNITQVRSEESIYLTWDTHGKLVLTTKNNVQRIGHLVTGDEIQFLQEIWPKEEKLMLISQPKCKEEFVTKEALRNGSRKRKET